MRGARSLVGRWRRVVTGALADLDAVIERDPAARSRFEVATLYPGVHAVWSHRISHAMWQRGAKYPARALSQFTRMVTNIEIHPGATLGPRLVIDHGAAVVVGETAVVGADVTIYHGVTLGGRSMNRRKRHPTVEDGVLIGTGAALLGPITVGEGSRIGANSVVVKSVPPGSVVVGVPGRVAQTSGSATDLKWTWEVQDYSI
ncbi:MAG: serine O-acetyltransferase [Actinobacteria bacterium]|nr:serine O-acetyltransferase [Actinomycetota bacterium]